MAQIHGARLKYLRKGFTILEMAYEFDKRLKYVGNDVYVCQKRKGNDLSGKFEIYGKWLTNGLCGIEMT